MQKILVTFHYFRQKKNLPINFLLIPFIKKKTVFKLLFKKPFLGYKILLTSA